MSFVSPHKLDQENGPIWAVHDSQNRHLFEMKIPKDTIYLISFSSSFWAWIWYPFWNSFSVSSYISILQFWVTFAPHRPVKEKMKTKLSHVRLRDSRWNLRQISGESHEWCHSYSLKWKLASIWRSLEILI